MRVEQAIFTSTRSRRAQGYHVVAASKDVEERLWQLLSTWGPSHASLLSDDPATCSWNFHPLENDWYAVSRTTYGGPEYSGRGGLQIFTHYLLVRRDQFAAFDNNPLTLARTAQALGHLRLMPIVPDSLNALDLPDHTLLDPRASSERDDVALDEVQRILRFQNRVMVMGLANPLPTLARLLRETPAQERLAMSFTTGLRPSLHRSFRIHFAAHADTALHSQLVAQGIDFVTPA